MSIITVTVQELKKSLIIIKCPSSSDHSLVLYIYVCTQCNHHSFFSTLDIENKPNTLFCAPASGSKEKLFGLVVRLRCCDRAQTNICCQICRINQIWMKPNRHFAPPPSGVCLSVCPLSGSSHVSVLPIFLLLKSPNWAILSHFRINQLPIMAIFHS